MYLIFQFLLHILLLQLSTRGLVLFVSSNVVTRSPAAASAVADDDYNADVFVAATIAITVQLLCVWLCNLCEILFYQEKTW